MAASDAITDAGEAQALIEDASAWDQTPALTAEQITRLVTRATSEDDAGADQWTVADLNRVVSLAWSWKAGIAASSFEAGVGPGKTFKLQQQYDHCVQMAGWYGNGTLSVVGSANASTGTRRSGIGSIGLTSVMNS